MNEFMQVLSALVLYRIVTIVVGLLLAYLGYRLFVLGVYEKAGDLKAVWGSHLLTLRQAAPGTFSALFGTVVISIALVRGINIDQIRQISSGTEQSSAAPPANDPGSVSLPDATSKGPNALIFSPVDDSGIDAITEKTKKVPLTTEEYKKLKEWSGSVTRTHVEVMEKSHDKNKGVI